MYLYNQAEMTDDVLRMLDFEIFIQCCLCETLQREWEYLIIRLLPLTGKMNTYTLLLIV